MMLLSFYSILTATAITSPLPSVTVAQEEGRSYRLRTSRKKPCGHPRPVTMTSGNHTACQLDSHAIGVRRKGNQRAATTSTSTRAFLGSVLTATAERAG